MCTGNKWQYILVHYGRNRPCDHPPDKWVSESRSDNRAKQNVRLLRLYITCEVRLCTPPVTTKSLSCIAGPVAHLRRRITTRGYLSTRTGKVATKLFSPMYIFWYKYFAPFPSAQLNSSEKSILYFFYTYYILNLHLGEVKRVSVDVVHQNVYKYIKADKVINELALNPNMLDFVSWKKNVNLNERLLYY